MLSYGGRRWRASVGLKYSGSPPGLLMRDSLYYSLYNPRSCTLLDLAPFALPTLNMLCLMAVSETKNYG